MLSALLLLVCSLRCSGVGIHDTLVGQHAWLAEATRQILVDCRLTATVNGDNVTVFTPNSCTNGHCHYKGQWLRDFAYGVEHAFELLPSPGGGADAVKAAALLFSNVRRADGVVAVDLLLTG